MKEFADRFLVPPGGWFYLHPESRTLIRSASFDRLCLEVRQYYAANSYPIPPSLSQLVVDQICERNPLFCANSEPPGPIERGRQFVVAMANWIAQGFRVVEHKVLEERRAICEVCPYWAGETMFGYGHCGKCGCTGLKLFLPAEKCPIDKWKAAL